ncbi:serine carboxypeptidase S28-domain-containing protein, partial [Blyttiomyces helicus]
MHLIKVLAMALLAPSVLANFGFQYSEQKRVRTQKRLKLEDIRAKNPTPRVDIMEPQYYKQAVSHFDASTHGTFKQLYFVNPAYYKPGGPIILYIAGEGPLSPDGSDIDAGVIFNDIAQQNSGLLVVLEHRYYGVSIPVPDFTTPNLRYLTIEEAVEDFNTFAQNVPLLVDINGKK